MGYTPPSKRYELDFTGTDYEGLEVTLKGLSTGQFLQLQKAMPGAAAGDPDAAEILITTYQKSIVEWNVEDDLGEPVKPTFDNVMEQDLSMTLYVVAGWMNAIAGVKADLGKDSTSGLPSAVVDLPTEAL